MDKRRDLVVGEGEVEMMKSKSDKFLDATMNYVIAAGFIIMILMMAGMLVAAAFESFYYVEGCLK